MLVERDELSGRSLGEFVIRERIGEGGFGAVYRCEQPLLGREAVVKVLHRRLRGSETALQRFLREARLASRLDHPYAAHVYAFGVEKDDGLIWIAMEMVHGTPLDQWLRERGKLPLDRLVPFFERIAEVVHTAHENGIVHRDIKPQNVMVIERAGRLLPKLLDLGIAKAMDDVARAPTPPPTVDAAGAPADAALDPLARTQVGQNGDKRPSEIDTLPADDDAELAAVTLARLTQAGAAVGSPPYMAPEQWLDAWSAGPRADLYSLGVLAYEALAGRRPFDAPTVHGYLAQHLHEPVPPLGADGTPALDRFFVRALAKEQADRYGTALELAAALRVASGLADETVAIPRLDESVRDAWLADGPQPLAEAIATLDGARNAHQARDAAWDLVHGVIRYLLVLGLAARAQVRDKHDDPQLVDLLRALRRRDLQEEERVRLLHLLVRPFATRRLAHPFPPLVDFAGESSADDARHPLDRVLELRASSDAGRLSDDLVRGHLAQLLPAVAQLLRATAFLLDHPLVVPRAGVVERWIGLRRARRPLATIQQHAPTDREPRLIDGEGNAHLLLSPLVQVLAPTIGADEEVFVFDGRGRHGARLVAAPAGFEHHDVALWDWLGEHVVGDDEALASSLDDDRAPYLGLSSFSIDDADRFVGREREIDAFVNRLRTHALGVVVGASGAGKSSFVHAGVVPALPAGWRAITMRPGVTPATTLAAKLAAASVSAVSLDTSPLVAIASIERAGGGTVVVVVDQLEELVTLCHDEAERTRFAAMLAQLSASPEAPLRVICTVRDDFLMRVEALAALRGRLSSALTLLGNPNRDDLVRMIVEPARRAGYELSEPELAQQMVDEVADRPGALALLSFTASRLWELRDRRFRQLARSAYDALGGVGGALGKHADDTFSALTGDDQRLARELVRHLVTSDGTRAVLSPTELRQILNSPRADDVIEKLVAARLVVVADAGGETRVEIIHEALITAWPRLQQWIREDAEGSRMRDQLRSAAKQWNERKRPKGLLWRDDALADLERWRRLPGVAALTDVEAAFADASRRDASRARRTRRVFVTAAFASLVAAVIILLRLTTEAREQRALASANASKAAAMAAETRERLAEQSEEHGRLAMLGGRSGVALLHFLAAIEQGARRDVALDFMMREATRAIDAQRRVLHGHEGIVTSIDVVDATRVLSSSEDGTIRLWNLATGHELVQMRAPTALGRARVDRTRTRVAASGKDGVTRVYAIDGRLLHELAGKLDGTPSYFHPAFSPDGSRIATVHGGERVVRIWNAGTGQLELAIPAGEPDRPFYGKAVEWSPVDDAIVTAGLGGELRDARTGRLRARLHHDDLITHVAFSVDGTMFATASADRTARIWDTRTGALRARLEGHAMSVEVVAFDASGRFVITGSRDLTVRVWDVRTGRLTSVLDGLSGTVRAATFSPDGTVIVTTTETGTIDVWDAPGGRHLGRLEGHGEAITGVRFAGDDLVTGSGDGTVRVWQYAQTAARAVSPCDEPTTVALDPDGLRMIAGCLDGNATLIALDRAAATPLRGHTSPIVAAGFIAGGVVALAEDRSLRVWHDDGRPDPTHALSTARASTLAVSSDRRTIVLGDDHRVIVADADTGRARSTWSIDASVSHVELSPDGKRVAVLSDRALEVYELETGARRVRIEERPSAMSFSPNGEIAVATGELVRRWDAAGRLLATSTARATILALRYDTRGDRLVTGSANGAIQIWRADGAALGQLEGHLGRVIDVGFDERGLVFSIGVDATLRVWDPSRSRLLASYRSHRGTPYELALTHAGLAVSNDSDGAIVIHTFPRGPVELDRIRHQVACLPWKLENGRATRHTSNPCP